MPYVNLCPYIFWAAEDFLELIDGSIFSVQVGMADMCSVIAAFVHTSLC